MTFEPNKNQEDLIAMMREARREQIERFEAACVTLRENAIPLPEFKDFNNHLPDKKPTGSLTPEELATMNEQIRLRRVSKEEYLKEVAKSPSEHGRTVIVVGGNQMGRGLVTARLIESLKKESHQVILVGGGEPGKLYGKEADQLIIDSLTELGSDRFNEKLLKQISPQLDTSQPYKKRKKGRNKSSFPGSGHY